MRVAQMLYHFREMPGMGQPFRSSVDQIAYLRGPRATGARIANTTLNWVSKYWYYGKHEFHPSEKDPELTAALIEWSSDGDATILDPFMGSGMTGVACIQTGRRFIGIEKERKYFDIAVQRIETALEQAKQMPLFEDVPKPQQQSLL